MLSQNITVVKGVEKKLEGSQLQLASSVSDVKQQILSLQHKFSALTTTTTPAPASTAAGEAKQSTRKKRDLQQTVDDLLQGGGEWKMKMLENSNGLL